MLSLRRQVTGSGPVKPGGIVILGEAPGDHEVTYGKPFVGPAGQELRRRILQAGLDENAIRFENVIEYKIADNDIKQYYLDKKSMLPGEALKAWFADTQARLKALSPAIVIAAGATALQAATGLTGIGAYHCTPCTGIGIEAPVIPIYHPSYSMRSPEMGIWLVIGMRKARRLLAGDKDIERNLKISPTLPEVLAFINQCKEKSICCIDLEAPKTTNEITCIGLAWDAQNALSIPLSYRGESYWSPEDEKTIWKALGTLFIDPTIQLVYHNFIYDSMLLSKHGIETGSNIYDTMVVANIIQPELEKGLGDLGRIYTLAPAWKKITDFSGNFNPEGLWLYNAKDAAITMQVYDIQKRELEHRKLLSFYQGLPARLYEPVYTMCARGWNFDKDACGMMNHLLTTEIQTLDKIIQALLPTGSEHLNINSPAQVKQLIKDLGLPVPTMDGDETTDKTALLKLINKYPEHKIFAHILRWKKLTKLLSTYVNVALDSDGRLRFSVNIAGTVSGRMSSAKTSWQTGFNSQNIPSRNKKDALNFRQFIIPDRGKTLGQVDLKTADARVTAWLAREERMIRIFEKNEDLHIITANRIFGKDIRTLPAAEYEIARYIGKKSNHSFNYRMKEQRFIDSLITEGDMFITMKEARLYRTAYFMEWPAIDIWQQSIFAEVRRSRYLTNPFGRVRYFHDRLDDRLWNQACAYIPSSTVADSINMTFIKLFEMKEQREELGLEIIQQGHDSLVFQFNSGGEAAVGTLLEQALSTTTFKIHDIVRVLPWDISFGNNWRDLSAWQKDK